MNEHLKQGTGFVRRGSQVVGVVEGQDLLHIIQGAYVREDDHVEGFLQVADELELLDQALAALLVLPWP